MPHSQALEMFKITKDFILISDYYENNIINGLQYKVVIIVVLCGCSY